MNLIMSRKSSLSLKKQKLKELKVKHINVILTSYDCELGEIKETEKISLSFQEIEIREAYGKKWVKLKRTMAQTRSFNKSV